MADDGSFKGGLLGINCQAWATWLGLFTCKMGIMIELTCCFKN